MCYPLHYEDKKRSHYFRSEHHLLYSRQLLKARSLFRALYLTFIDHTMYDKVTVEMELRFSKLQVHPP